MKHLTTAIAIIFLAASCSNDTPINTADNSDRISNSIQPSKKTDNDFKFLGEKVGRKENFDTNIIVTKENIERLYSNYNVNKLTDLNYFKIESKKIFEGSRYLTRLIKFVDNKQSKAINFYDYTIADFKLVKEYFIIGLNSLSYSSPDYPSCFCVQFSFP